MVTKFWIEKGWGDSIDNAMLSDVDVAIDETTKMDEEHGAFWARHLENEYVLEVHRNLTTFLVYGKNQDEQIQTKLTDWEEVKYFFQLFFAGGNSNKLKTKLRGEHLHIAVFEMV